MTVKDKDKLKELTDPSNYGNENEKKKVFDIVMAISRKVEYEVPNSATFTMALDSLEGDEPIYSIISKKKRNYDEDEIITTETK